MKASLCVAGNMMLYELCEKYGISHRKSGKLTVATSEEETGELEELLEMGKRNGVEGLRILSRQELKKLEHNVEGIAALLTPSTGIIDSYALMKYFIARATERGAQIAYQSRVAEIERVADGYRVTVEDGSGESSFSTRILVNCAGLNCDRMAELAGIDIAAAGYRLHYCKGEYFSVGGGKNKLVSRLIYPVPPRDGSLGIHVTLDLDGRLRLGPSNEYVDRVDYSVNGRHKQIFYNSVKRFLPFIEYNDLEPEMAGVRPRLQGPGEGFKDFIIREESDKGLPGLINLIGIESPGLTASPAIASFVGDIIGF